MIPRPLLSVFVLSAAALPAAAQSPAVPPAPVAFEVFADSELEPYLRTLQNVGLVGAHPWSVRQFSATQVRAMAAAGASHPWEDWFDFRAGGSDQAYEYGWIGADARTIYNSSFPWGGNDGPLWAGRGMTGALSAGAHARLGPVRFVLAPVAFMAQNKAFGLAPLEPDATSEFQSELTPLYVDLPQRFGPDTYGRVDWGNSSLALDAAGLSLGISNAAQHWGPTDRHPLILGSNSGGFAHAFLETVHPLDLWMGEIHGRYMVGRLEQTGWVNERSLVGPRRSGTGFAVTFMPRGLEGLEIGMTRFFHREWPEGGIGRSEILQPLEAIFKNSISDADQRAPDNQLASLFARWNFAAAGVEVWGEFIRQDHSVNARALAVEPDDLSGYTLGFRRVWNDEGQGGLSVLRAESTITTNSHRERGGARIRDSAFNGQPYYQHAPFVQGHTQRGQLLASPAGHGGHGLVVGWDRYDSRGRWSVEFERRLQRDRTTGIAGEKAAVADVFYALGGSVLHFAEAWDVEVAGHGVYNLNRYLHSDQFNLNLAATVRMPFR